MRYRYHWTFKLLALVLAVISGAVLVLGCCGLLLGDLGYYERSRQSQLYSNVRGFCHQAANAVFDRFAWKDTGIEPMLFERFFRWDADVDAIDELEQEFYYQIRSAKNGEVLESTCPARLDWDWSDAYTFDVRRGYVTEMPKSEYYPTYEEVTRAADGMVYADLESIALPPLREDVTDFEYYVVSDNEHVNWQNVSTDSYRHADAEGADYTIYRIEYTVYESYHVEVYMTAEQTVNLLDSPMEDEFLPKLLAKYSAYLGPMAIWGVLVLGMALLWLALVSGKSPYRQEIKPEGLNQIPLDLYLVGVGVAALGLAILTSMVLDQIVHSSVWGYYDGTRIESFYRDLAMLALCGMGMGGLIALFAMACAAQMKVGDNYWLKHTSVGLCWRYGGVVLTASVKGAWHCVKAFFRKIRAFLRLCVDAAKRFTVLLPLTWQWLIASGCVWLLMFLCIFRAIARYSFFALFFGIGVTVLLVLYGAYCFGCLRDAAKKMSEGSLEEKIENKYLAGCFGEFAEHLNSLGDTCVEAAMQQMKSERMKSELITNVSHDIKTPLTSIINYVDLLQRTENEAERKEYLEVLDRQSQKLKKLIEDLMEMSKASSGNVAVEITPTDVCEAVNQALGEFADAMDACHLQVMCKTPAEPVMALCDGKHLWRVLSNVLSNTVKYALPGTRVYVDVTRKDQKVEVSIKNISAQMLNITSEELMERFVRGDSSRNTEGNGLGLNIAKSLMEVQGGKLALTVDGDLFKVLLTLNAA